MNDVYLVLLLAAPVVDWATVGMISLVIRAAAPSVPRSLRERRLVAAAIATGVTIVAALALNARWHVAGLTPDVITAVLIAAILAPTSVNLVWLWRGLRGTL